MAKLLSLVLVVLVAWVLHLAIFKLTHRAGLKKVVTSQRIRYVARCLQLANVTILALIVIFIVGVDYAEVALFLSSVFAVMGVALFAQWSILSNLTASLLIFFLFPYRIGDKIKVLDKDDDISGDIEEIGAFHVLIRTAAGDLITYPNSLILQKGVVKRDSNGPRDPHIDL